MCTNQNEKSLNDRIVEGANTFLRRHLGPNDILTTFGDLDLIERNASVSFMELDLGWLEEPPTSPNLYRLRKGIALSLSAKSEALVVTEGELIEMSFDAPCINHPYVVDDEESET